MVFLKSKYKNVMVIFLLILFLKNNIYYENYFYNLYIGYVFLMNLIIWLKLYNWFFL